RELIRASVIAGAAAWTAPVIVDSLVSPAAALSACSKHFVKLTPSGGCFSACFGSSSSVSFPVIDAYWGGDCAYPGSCPDAGDGSTNMPGSVTTVTNKANVTYYQVTFTNGCTFSSQTDWQIGGRYGPGSPGSNYRKVAGATCGSGGPTGDID